MKRSFLFIISFITVLTVKAQFLHIEAISVPNFVYEGMPVNMSFKVKNTGLSSYNGTMMLYMAEQFYDFPKDIYTDSVFLQANDSILINTNATFQNYFFQYGNNIVVVWPKGINVQNDSVSFPLYMDYNLLVDEYSNDKFYVYPNPVVNQIKINYSTSSNSIEQVRILDNLGRLVYVEEFKNSDIDLSNFKSGIYFLELVLSNNKSLFSKIQKL